VLAVIQRAIIRNLRVFGRSGVTPSRGVAGFRHSSGHPEVRENPPAERNPDRKKQQNLNEFGHGV
jgi:hypothetical protein